MRWPRHLVVAAAGVADSPAAPASTRLSIALGALALILLALGLYMAPLSTAALLALVGLGTPLLILTWTYLELGLLGLMFLASGFIRADTFDIRLPIGGLDLRDLLLFGLIGLVLLRQYLQGRVTLAWWPVSRGLILMMAYGVFSALYAILYLGVEPNWTLGELRPFIYYSTFFLTVWTLQTRAQLNRLLWGLFILADVTVVVMLIQQFFGRENQLLQAMAVDWRVWDAAAGDGAGAGFGAVRIVPPSHVLVYFMSLIAFALVMSGGLGRRQRVHGALQVVFLNIGLLLTYTRAQWIASVLALILMSVVLFAAYRREFSQKVGAGLLIGLVTYALIGPDLVSMVKTAPFFENLLARASTIFQPDETLETHSLEWRVFETEQSLRSIAERPILGVGLGNTYRDLTLLQGEATGWMNPLWSGKYGRFTRFIHNSYLYITVKMGVLGLATFVFFTLSVLVYGWHGYRALKSAYGRALVLAILMGYLGLLAWAVTHHHLMLVESTSAMGLMIGLIAVALQVDLLTDS